MILVKAEDSFLYQTKFVNTGNKVYVELKDIPKLVAAGKINPSYMEHVEAKTPQTDTPSQDSPDKFLKQPENSEGKYPADKARNQDKKERARRSKKYK